MNTITSIVAFVCPECGMPLRDSGSALSCANGHGFDTSDGVNHLLPSTVNPLALEDAEYHAAQKDTWLDHNQGTAYRNVYYHEAILRTIAQHSRSDSRILEVGGGVGFDLELFLRMKPAFGLYVFSEISRTLALHAAARYREERTVFCTIDAQHLPFADGYFDCVYMMAALHHLENIEGALKELVRVTKPGGLICAGIEPNMFWVRLLDRTKVVWRRLLPQRSHSPADEEAHGLTYNDFHRHGASLGLVVQQIEPVWLLSGFCHYGLEFLYRLLRLERRITLPLLFEKALVACDRFLLRLPGLKRISWHYSVVYTRS